MEEMGRDSGGKELQNEEMGRESGGKELQRKVEDMR